MFCIFLFEINKIIMTIVFHFHLLSQVRGVTWIVQSVTLFQSCISTNVFIMLRIARTAGFFTCMYALLLLIMMIY
jgi:hypothetical protein